MTTIPADKPLRVKFSFLKSMSFQTFSTNYPVSDAPSSYRLYANRQFKGIPDLGDPFGFVAQVARCANVKSSGVEQIEVCTHKVTVSFSAAVDFSDQAQLMRSAVLATASPKTGPITLMD